MRKVDLSKANAALVKLTKAEAKSDSLTRGYQSQAEQQEARAVSVANRLRDEVERAYGTPERDELEQRYLRAVNTASVCANAQGLCRTLMLSDQPDK